MTSQVPNTTTISNMQTISNTDDLEFDFELCHSQYSYCCWPC